MASLRSFLDPPVRKGKTLKGSGKVGYHLHSRNHSSNLVLDGSLLHQQVLRVSLLLLCSVVYLVISVLGYFKYTYTCPFLSFPSHFVYVHVDHIRAYTLGTGG